MQYLKALNICQVEILNDRICFATILEVEDGKVQSAEALHERKKKAYLGILLLYEVLG